MPHLSRRRSLKATAVVFLGLSGCIGSNHESDIYIFNQTASTRTVEIDIIENGSKSAFFSDSTSISADERHVYDDPIPEEAVCEIQIRTDGGLETGFEWKSGYAETHSVQFSIRESQIETSHGTA
ncbi:hypothetical protein [Halomicrobium zhouii]|uniref:hypothetical protein n=1 Tax=Halomicrobium zhouii TaxID=767519 RepID=UPI0011608CAF|nr:hypothetical protein [Halomicrobium zhouii]